MVRLWKLWNHVERPSGSNLWTSQYACVYNSRQLWQLEAIHWFLDFVIGPLEHAEEWRVLIWNGHWASSEQSIWQQKRHAGCIFPRRKPTFGIKPTNNKNHGRNSQPVTGWNQMNFPSTSPEKHTKRKVQWKNNLPQCATTWSKFEVETMMSRCAPWSLKRTRPRSEQFRSSNFETQRRIVATHRKHVI